MATTPTVDLTAELARLNYRKRPLTNSFTFSRFGRSTPKTALTAVETHNTMLETMAGDFISFQVILHNYSAAAITGVRCQAGVSNALGQDNVIAVTPAGGSWTDCTLNGSTSINLPAQIANEIPSLTFLDVTVKRSLVRTDGGNKGIICVRIQFPSGCQPCVPANNTYYWASSGNAQPIYKGTVQQVSGITTAGSFTTTAINYSDVYVPMIKYNTARAGKLIMVCGDSTVEGIGGDIRAFGAVQRACAALSTPTAPYEWFNAALHAQTPSTYSQMITNHLSVVNPTGLVYSPYSINNTYTSSTVDTILTEDYLSLGRVLSTVSGRHSPPALYLLDGAPTNTAYRDIGAYDASVRQALNTELASYKNAYGQTMLIPGYAASVSGTTGSNGQVQILANMNSTDNVHFSNLGYTTLQATVQPTIASI
jgi:hypothetical protein